MPLWTQNLLVLLAVLGCVAFIAWHGYAALHGKKSKLSGCGSCKTCGTEEPPKPKPAGEQRVAIIPLEMLARRRK
jgi:hypothetical protein